MPARVFGLAEALRQNIRIQLSVSKYQAISLPRGANLDSIDFALNDRVWLKNEFAKTAKAPGERQLVMIGRVVNCADSGPGGFYNHPGDPTSETHLLAGESYDSQSGFSGSRFLGFGDIEPRGGARLMVHNGGDAG